MSFSFNASGTKPEVLRQLEEATASGDTSQFEAARAFVRSEIEASPDVQGQGYLVQAAGHHDANTRQITISITPTSVPAQSGGGEGTQEGIVLGGRTGEGQTGGGTAEQQP